MAKKDNYTDDFPAGVECPVCGTWRRITAMGNIEECTFCMDEEHHLDNEDEIDCDD